MPKLLFKTRKIVNKDSPFGLVPLWSHCSVLIDLSGNILTYEIRLAVSTGNSVQCSNANVE